MSRASSISEIVAHRRSFLTRVVSGAVGLPLLGSSFSLVQGAEPRAAANTALPVKPGASADDVSIRPFHISFPDEALVDLRRRVAATRWPDKETVADASQGVQRRPTANGRTTRANPSTSTASTTVPTSWERRSTPLAGRGCTSTANTSTLSASILQEIPKNHG